MATLDELTTPLTRDEVKTLILDAIAAQGVDTTAWKPGSVVRTFIAGTSIVLAGFSQLQALVARGGFLDLTSGEWLTLLARHLFGVERDEGSFATGEVQLDNTGGGVYSGDVGDLIVRNPTTDKIYRNTEPFSIGSNETGVLVDVKAVEIGADSTSAPDTITEFETPLLGVTVTNPSAVVGSDPETDPELRTRCREKTGPLSPNGPADAYRFVARSATDADGNSIGVTRVKTVPDGSGGVDVFVATGSGGVSGNAGDPSTDLGAVADEIHRKVEPISVTPDVQSAVVHSQAVDYILWILDTISLTTSEIETEIEDRLTEYLSERPIGGEAKPGGSGKIWRDALTAVVGSVFPDHTVDVVIVNPGNDISVSPDAAPVLGTVTPTINKIPEAS